jgi:hypothetical protein
MAKGLIRYRPCPWGFAVVAAIALPIWFANTFGPQPTQAQREEAAWQANIDAADARVRARDAAAADEAERTRRYKESVREELSKLHDWQIRERTHDAALIYAYNQTCGPVDRDLFRYSATILSLYPTSISEINCRMVGQQLEAKGMLVH